MERVHGFKAINWQGWNSSSLLAYLCESTASRLEPRAGNCEIHSDERGSVVALQGGFVHAMRLLGVHGKHVWGKERPAC